MTWDKYENGTPFRLEGRTGSRCQERTSPCMLLSLLLMQTPSTGSGQFHLFLLCFQPNAHQGSDPARGRGAKGSSELRKMQLLDQENMSLMAELDEGPPPQQVRPISQTLLHLSCIFRCRNYGSVPFHVQFSSPPPATSWLDWKLRGHRASSDAAASA